MKPSQLSRSTTILKTLDSSGKNFASSTTTRSPRRLTPMLLCRTYHLANVKLHKANCNHGQGNFINQYKVQKNKFNEIARDFIITDPQAIRTLQNVVSGTPNLAPVLNQCRQARKAAGNTIDISFDKHCSLLSEQIR